MVFTFIAWVTGGLGLNLSHQIQAVWVISIRDVIPTDLSPVFAKADIRAVFCNGKTSGAYYARYQEKTLGIKATVLPSTSPANAAWSMDRLADAWQCVALAASDAQ